MIYTEKNTGDMGSRNPGHTEIQGMWGAGGHGGDTGDTGTKVTQAVGIRRTWGKGIHRTL